MKKAVLLDVSAMMYRAYYSLINMTNSKGEPTGAVYGFTNMLTSILDEFNPDYICAAYDVKRASLKRSEKFENYKADRKPMPEDLLKQLPYIEKVIDGFGIKAFKVEGYEADDVLGTLAKKFSENNVETYVMTGDKDLSQIIDENINIALLGKGEGKSRFKIISTDEDVIEQLGVKASLIPDLFGLIGDKVDGIPGVRKVGVKKAVPMLLKYGNLEGIYDHVDELVEMPGIGKGLVENIREDKELAFMSRELAVIETNVPLDLRIDETSLTLDKSMLYEIYSELEIRTIIKKLDLKKEETNGQISLFGEGQKVVREKIEGYKRVVVKSEEEFNILLGKLADGVEASIYFNKVGFAISFNSESYYIPCKHSYLGAVNFDKVEVERLFATETKWLTYKFKEILNEKYSLENVKFDVNLAHYLITANTKESIETIIEGESGETLKSYADYFDKLDQVHTDIDKMALYSFERSEGIISIYSSLEEKLKRENLEELYYNVELPLARVLANMENEGIKINLPYFEEFRKELSKKITDLVPKIYEEVQGAIRKNYENLELSEFNIIEKYIELGKLMYKKKADLNVFNREFDSLSIEELLDYQIKFNIASPKQLGIIFFDLMKLPVIKKTKTGYSVNEEVLEVLKNQGAKVCEYLLEYRKLTKLLSTYVEALPKLADKNGRIHTTFNQTGTATGRLSSSDPNLQNIPSRSDEGIRIREGFVPKDGYKLLALDYSQIELRVLTSLSKDENLIKAYEDDLDLHSLTAKKLFEIDEESEISREQRAIAKIVNFSIIYGKTAFGLANELNISNDDARLYIKRYFEQYPKVKEFERSIVEEATSVGSVRTMYNRRRIIPELRSSNKNIKQQGERMAVNTVIQGSAADILKVIMVKVSERINGDDNIKMLLQVHDELLFEVKEDKIDEYKEIIRDIMENSIELDYVKLKTNIAYGNSWAEAK